MQYCNKEKNFDFSHRSLRVLSTSLLNSQKVLRSLNNHKTMENETSAEGLPENGIPQEDVEDDDGVTTTDPQKKSKLSSFINKVKSVSSFTSSMSQNESFEGKRKSVLLTLHCTMLQKLSKCEVKA